MQLRKLKLKDSEYMLEWMHDKSVVSELKTDFASKTVSDCNEFIIKSIEDKENIHLAIINDEDEYMGTVSLKNIHLNTAEFGITIRSKAMGKGYSLFAMKEIIRIGFEKLNLNEIYWCVSPLNERACRFYDKNEFNKCHYPENILLRYSEKEREQFLWYKVLRADYYEKIVNKME